MKIVLSIEQMKHLEELGLDTSDASMCWYPDNDPDFPDDTIYGLTSAEQIGINYPGRVSTYNLQDILEKLPNDSWRMSSNGLYINVNNIYHKEESNNMVLNAYKILLLCIENNYVKTNKA